MPEVANDVGFAIGRRFQEARGERHQSTYAEELGITQPTISMWERGLIPQSWLTLRRAVELGIDANWLLTGHKNGRRKRRPRV